MLTSALGLDMSLLLLANHHSYPEGKANRMRVITTTKKGDKGNKSPCARPNQSEVITKPVNNLR